MATAERISVKQLALAVSEELEETISAKQLRVWLRSQDQGVGQGKRYSFTQKQADKLAEKYVEYRETLSDDEE